MPEPERWKVGLRVSYPFSFTPFPNLSLPFPFPFCFTLSPFPCPSFFPPLPSPSLEVRPPKILLMGSVGALWVSPAGSGVEPQPKSNLVHFSFKRWDLVASSLIIFRKINWPNWQILRSLYVCLCFVPRIGRLGPLPRWLRHWIRPRLRPFRWNENHWLWMTLKVSPAVGTV